MSNLPEDQTIAAPETPRDRVIGLLFLAILIACVLWPLLFMRWYDSHETVRYLLRLDALQINFVAQGGHPRWIPECAAGRGMPYFTFYAPGFTYVCLPFTWLGLESAVKVAILLVTSIGAWSAWRLGTEWGGPRGGMLAALLAVASPYPLHNLYERGDLAEYSANHLALPVLLLLWRLISGRGSWRTSLAAGLVYGAMLLQHNVSSLLLTGVFVVFVVGLGLIGRIDGPRWRRLALVLPVGLVVSMWFWLPVLVQLPLVWTDGLVQGFYDPVNNILRGTWWAWMLTKEYPVLGPVLCGTTVAVAGMAVLGWIPRARASFLCGGIVALVLLMNPTGAWFWKYVPLAAYAQFPYRLLGATTLMAALAASHLINARLKLRARPILGPRFQLAVMTAALVTAAIMVGASFTELPHSSFEPRQGFMQYWVENPTDMKFYGDNLTEGEFTPRSADPRNWPDFQGRVAIGQGTEVLASTRHGNEFYVRVSGGQGRVFIHQFSFPAWRASVDGVETACEIGPGGSLAVPVPAGSSEVRAHTVRTGLEAACEWVSVIALIVVLGALAVGLRRKPQETAVGGGS